MTKTGDSLTLKGILVDPDGHGGTHPALRAARFEAATARADRKVTSQREIEKAVRGALDAARLKGTETLAVHRCRE